MRKWYVILMTAVGTTLFMMIGYGDITPDNSRITDGHSLVPESGASYEKDVAPAAVDIVVSLNRAAFTALERVTERFEAERPYVSVTLKNVPAGDLNRLYRLQSWTGDAADVMLLPTAWVRPEAAAGRLMALDNYITAERQSQWFETVRGAVRWNGYIWGVPAGWDPYVFVMRADADFLEAGDPPVTVNEWLALVEDSTYPGSNPVNYAEALLQQWALPEEQSESAEAPNEEAAEPAASEQSVEADGETAEDSEVTAEAAEETAEAEGEQDEAAEATVQAAEVSMEPQSPGEANGTDEATLVEAEEVQVAADFTIEAVRSGEAAWALVPLSEALREREKQGRPELSVAAFIPDESQPRGGMPPFIGSSYVILPSAEHPQEAADWIRYVTEAAILDQYDLLPAGQMPVYRAVFGLPASSSTAVPALLATSGEAQTTAELPGGSREGANSWRMLRTVMRLMDRMTGGYGSPSGEVWGMH